ncbi:ABC transporter ATP-binding protein [Candidatus Pristimantibacillus sp. PTI5]|uniref:ABC transporter ATP-binding protein n=1 Tax=Candidatus Pristimantibacillus sp. PTI5 TaxID=3400422 RepID=UPI003B01C55B
MKYIRWIWEHIASIRGGFVLALLFMLIETNSGLAMTYLQKFIIDDVFMNGKYHLLVVYLPLFALAIIINAAFLTIAPYRYVYNEYRMDDILLQRMLRRFFRVPMSLIQNERSARYVQYITMDLHQGGSMIGYQTPIGVQRALEILLLMGIIGWYSPMLLVCILVFSSIYIVGIQYFGKRIKAVRREVEDNRTHMMVHLEESVAATREIIAYHRTSWEAVLYQTLFKKYFDSVIRETKQQNKQILFVDPLGWTITLALLGIGGYQLFENHLSLGAFVILFQFTNQLMEAFDRLFRYVMGVSGMLANIDRMELLMNEQQVDPGTASFEKPVETIRFDQVDFAYESNGHQILQQLNFNFTAGKKIAFVGASGGGKSTIAQLLVRFYEPDSGAILVNGQSLKEVKREEWSKRVRIVFQDPYMMSDTVKMNLTFGKDVFLPSDLEEACRVVQLYDDIDMLPHRFEEEVGERGVQLSGGQKQRLALARAILDDPEILILDEATSSLDLETERLLQARLDQLRQGKTTIIIAHRLSTVRNADIIFVMDNGRIVEQGTHDELISLGRVYPSLVSAQAQIAQTVS